MTKIIIVWAVFTVAIFTGGWWCLAHFDKVTWFMDVVFPWIAGGLVSACLGFILMTTVCDPPKGH